MCIVIDKIVNCLKGAGAIGEVWGDSSSWQLFLFIFLARRKGSLGMGNVK